MRTAPIDHIVHHEEEVLDDHPYEDTPSRQEKFVDAALRQYLIIVSRERQEAHPEEHHHERHPVHLRVEEEERQLAKGRALILDHVAHHVEECRRQQYCHKVRDDVAQTYCSLSRLLTHRWGA